MQQVRSVGSYALNKNVFSLFLNMFNDTSVHGVLQEDCSTPEVLGRRSCCRRISFWYVERSVDRSVQIEVAGC